MQPDPVRENVSAVGNTQEADRKCTACTWRKPEYTALPEFTHPGYVISSEHMWISPCCYQTAGFVMVPSLSCRLRGNWLALNSTTLIGL